MSAAEWTDTYGIHHWRILRSSYRKLAWVGFEPTTTEFRSDALTDWAIRPWVQLALRANFVQLLQFHLFVQFSRFISAIAFVSRRICFKPNLALVITWVQRNELIHLVFTICIPSLKAIREMAYIKTIVLLWMKVNFVKYIYYVQSIKLN